MQKNMLMAGAISASSMSSGELKCSRKKKYLRLDYDACNANLKTTRLVDQKVAKWW